MRVQSRLNLFYSRPTAILFVAVISAIIYLVAAIPAEDTPPILTRELVTGTCLVFCTILFITEISTIIVVIASINSKLPDKIQLQDGIKNRNYSHGFISSFLSFCREKATKALCIGRIQTRLGVVLFPSFPLEFCF